MKGNEVGLLTDELKTALEHVSGKSIDGSFQTTAEMLHAFNSSYKCKVRFDVFNNEGSPLEGYTLTVKQGEEVIEISSDERYYLEAGTYKYSCTCEGFTDVTDTELTINASDVSRGTKTITIQMTLAAEG